MSTTKETEKISPESQNNGIPPSRKQDDIDLIERASLRSHPSQTGTALEELSVAHKEFLLQRHGTLDLDPIPSFSSADPYNWPTWKKTINLTLVAFHAMMATFTAGSIIPAYENIAQEFGVSMQRSSYLTSLQIAILGGAPLLWRPLANHFGRRPIFLLSTICSLAGNIGCAKSPDYASLAACRAITAFFISPAAALGSAVVMETFFKKQRARYMGIWTVMVTLGVPVGPLIFGFVTYRVGFRWIFWILAIVNGVQFILYLFLGPETRFLVDDMDSQTSDFRKQYLSLRRIDPKPLTFWEFFRPLTLAKNPTVLIPAVAYAMVFLFGSILTTVEIPQLLQTKFDLNAEQVGMQFIAIIIGSILGEQLGGSMSDAWMNQRAKRTNRRPEPEFRLWLSYIGFVLTIVGIIIFLVRTQLAHKGHWEVSPIVGAGIAAFGNQVVTTVLVTYAIDSLPHEAASVGVFITFVRQIWGFIGPFWFTSMFENVGTAASSGVSSALMAGVSFIPTILLQWQGKRWRSKEAEPVLK